MSDDRKNRYIRDEIQQKHSNYVRNKNKKIKPSIKDEDIIKLGETWHAMGHLLEDAEAELQQDFNFVCGYRHAVTQEIVNDHLYSLGVEYCEKGIPIEEIPTNYTDKIYFMRGYNDTLKSSLNSSKKNSKR